MDIRQIGCFIEVAKLGNFTRAAERLHLSQSALSKAILALEEEWSVSLFDRSTRHVRLTKAGIMYLKQCMEIMKSVEELNGLTGDLGLLRKGYLRLGLPPVVGSSFFPAIIAKFLEKYPGVEIELAESGSKEIERQVQEGALDVGIAVLPVNEERLEAVKIVDRTLYLVVPSSHPLAGREHVKLAELRNERFLLFKRGFALFDLVHEACVEAGFEPGISFESSQWDFLSEAVAAGLGITFLPETICTMLEPSRFHVIHSVTPGIPWQLAVIRNRHQVASRAEKAWIEFVRNWFADNVTS